MEASSNTTDTLELQSYNRTTRASSESALQTNDNENPPTKWTKLFRASRKFMNTSRAAIQTGIEKYKAIHPEEIQGYCSWCFQPAKHTMIERKIVGRCPYQCSNCLASTVLCQCFYWSAASWTCKGMARGYQVADDLRCYLCTHKIKSWDDLEENHKQCCVQGYCSWCFEKAEHKLTAASTFGRDVYQCQLCRHQTAMCKTCPDSFVQADGVVVNFRKCAKCLGLIESWDNVEENKRVTSIQARHCSWCFECTSHSLEETGMVLRAVYRCDRCRARTVTCKSCTNGMARGGQGLNDFKCAQCEGHSWDFTKAKRERVFGRVRELSELRTDLLAEGLYRRRAKEAGLLRPYLLLVSMTPQCRNQLACSLGFTLVTDECFGNPHAESWNILIRPLKGIQDRGNEVMETLNPYSHKCTWWDVLYRTSIKVFHQCSHPQVMDDESRIGSLEDELLCHMAQIQRQKLSPAQIAASDELLERPEVQELVAKLEAKDIHKDLLRLTVDSIFVALDNQGLSVDSQCQEIAHMLQLQMNTNNPQVGAAMRGIHQSVMLKLGFGAAALVGGASLVAGPLAVFGMAWMASDMVKFRFGSSLDVVLPAIVQILMQKLALAANGLTLAEMT